MDYHLRLATPADDAVQLAIYASTRTEELALAGWPPAQREAFVLQQHVAQQHHYRSYYPQSGCHLIIVDGDAVAGRLWLDERADRLHILDIALLPAWRRQGLGTACLQALGVAASTRPLSIQVEIHNPARRLYERLGFVAEGAPQGLHQFMVRRVGARHLQPEESLP
jgi:ribosomal protein S18 acetylase RimI-like enzyme